MTKEQIYDEQVAPLMKQVLSVCKEHKIAMVAQFAVPTEDDPDLLCTSALLDDQYEPHPHMIAALRVLKPSPQAFSITIRGIT